MADFSLVLHHGYMADGGAAMPAWERMTEEQSGRWAEVLDGVAGMLPSGAVSVVVDGGRNPGMFADRLAARLHAAGRRCARLAGADAGIVARASGTVTLADGPRLRARSLAGGWDVVVWLRTSRAADGDGEHGADIVIDLHDATWPVIRHVALPLAGRGKWH